MPAEQTCPKCGTPLSSDALEGLCPKCVRRVAFEECADPLESAAAEELEAELRFVVQGRDDLDDVAGADADLGLVVALADRAR